MAKTETNRKSKTVKTKTSKKEKIQVGKITKTSKTTKNNKKKALCHLCGKEFSKVANVNAHIKKEHEGLRWVCPICRKTQVSRHSHVRHLSSKHKEIEHTNPDANARYMDDTLPEAAKDATISNLKERNQVLEVSVKHFRTRLMEKLNENINLKAKLGLDAESDKLEFNNLVRFTKTIRKSESSENSAENSIDEELEEEEMEEEEWEAEAEELEAEESTISTQYPENGPENDPLEHIKESDPGASGSREQT